MAGDDQPKLTPEELAAKIARALLKAPPRAQKVRAQKHSAPKGKS
jgi:hypothetical protein